MVLQYYDKRPKDTSNRDFLSQIRQRAENVVDQGFDFPDLEKTFSKSVLRPAEIDRDQSIDEAMTKIGSATDSIHFPVIVLVHAEELGHGSVYADHFVLVRGMTSDMKTVYLNTGNAERGGSRIKLD
jgi:hypothetical protein